MDIPLEQMQAKGKETDRPPLMSNRLQEPYELLKELTHWFNILCCPQPQSRWETGSEQDGAFSTPWDTFFPFTLPCTSSGVSAREMPALQNVRGARMPAPAGLSYC